jgi:hypothetical protein
MHSVALKEFLGTNRNAAEIWLDNVRLLFGVSLIKVVTRRHLFTLALGWMYSGFRQHAGTHHLALH